MKVEKKDKIQRVYDFLNDHNIATLCVVGPDGAPWAATILYTLDKSLTFFFVIKSETKKYDSMKKNKVISLVVTEEETLKTVQMQGKVEELKDTEQQIEATTRLAKAVAKGNIDWPPPISKMKKGSYKFMKMTPTWMRFADFRGFVKNSTGAKDWYEQIIP